MSNYILKIKEGITLQNLIILSYILSILCSWGYGNSYMLYALLSIGLAMFAYGTFVIKVMRKCSKMEFVIILLLLTTLFTSLFNNGIKSMIMVNISLILPFAISYLEINYTSVNRQIIFASLTNFIFVIIMIADKAHWNSNSLAFMIFNGISIGFVWFKVASSVVSKVSSVIYLLVASAFLLSVGSRNAGIVIAICLMLLLIPNRIFKNKWFFRIIYLSAMLATVFASEVMAYVFENENLMKQLVEYTSSYSEKAWGMDTHLSVLLRVKSQFSELGFFTRLLGEGVKTQHTHNLFYQSLYFYGYLGTIILYIIYIIIFEIARKIIVEYEDTIIIGCCIIMIGHFLMQIGEVYMWGSESAIIISLLPAGLVLQQRRKKGREKKRRIWEGKYENSIDNTLL